MHQTPLNQAPLDISTSHFLLQAEIVTNMDVFHLPIRAIVIEGEPPIDLDNVIDEEDRDPCDDPIDPWGAFILCRRCLTHHLAWWSKNLGYYECQKCWHFHVTQEWLEAMAENELQAKIDKVKKTPDRDESEPGIIGPPWLWFVRNLNFTSTHVDLEIHKIVELLMRPSVDARNQKFIIATKNFMESLVLDHPTCDLLEI